MKCCFQIPNNKRVDKSLTSLGLGFRIKNEAENAIMRLPDKSNYLLWYSGDRQGL